MHHLSQEISAGEVHFLGALRVGLQGRQAQRGQRVNLGYGKSRKDHLIGG
jgi:hypothetical protein